MGAGAVLLLLVMAEVMLAVSISSSMSRRSFSRHSFPEGFIFGAGSAAYQFEGGAREDGKGPSIWDTFTKDYPEKIADHSNGNVADDLYHRYKDDIKLMRQLGIDSFRFSIAWTRIFPKGKLSGGINKAGIKHYNDFINDLLANGIQPLVTLFHWDVPQALEDEYGGFLSPRILDDFYDYVDVCFREFGDRVKYWVTINEPNFFSEFGYAYGYDAPGRCSKYINNCTYGNSATEPYLVAHHMILSHASAVLLYKQQYQTSQKGIIGVSVNANWYLPLNQTSADIKAAYRAFDFFTGWILEPLTFGHYPETMRSLVGSRLPVFSKEQSQMLNHTYDFIGLNYYTSSYAADDTSFTGTNLSYTTDSHVTTTEVKDGVPIGEPTSLDWLYIYPQGLQSLVVYVKEKYSNPPIMITENGYGNTNNDSLPISFYLEDHVRIKYLQGHLAYLLKGIKQGANVIAYYAWSLFDDFEWFDGYTTRFGLHFIDYGNDLQRYPKKSAFWFKKFLQNRSKTYHSPI
ncbi:hypothetical protein Droror1_Dr00012012 [Drosera rotundifolia]